VKFQRTSEQTNKKINKPNKQTNKQNKQTNKQTNKQNKQTSMFFPDLNNNNNGLRIRDVVGSNPAYVELLSIQNGVQKEA